MEYWRVVNAATGEQYGKRHGNWIDAIETAAWLNEKLGYELYHVVDR